MAIPLLLGGKRTEFIRCIMYLSRKLIQEAPTFHGLQKIAHWGDLFFVSPPELNDVF